MTQKLEEEQFIIPNKRNDLDWRLGEESEVFSVGKVWDGDNLPHLNAPEWSNNSNLSNCHIYINSPTAIVTLNLQQSSWY